jgi:hypothetical protein
VKIRRAAPPGPAAPQDAAMADTATAITATATVNTVDTATTTAAAEAPAPAPAPRSRPAEPAAAAPVPGGPGIWLPFAAAGLCALSGAAATVSYAAQYRLVYAARRLAVAALLEAAIPDAAALVFACLGVALALLGRRAIRARLLNMASAGTSVFMNVIAAAPGWRNLAVWAMPPAAYVLASDTLIGAVARRQPAAQPKELTLLAGTAWLALWLLRLSVAPRSTLGGFRAWGIEECPVAPGRRAPAPSRRPPFPFHHKERPPAPRSASPLRPPGRPGEPAPRSRRQRQHPGRTGTPPSRSRRQQPRRANKPAHRKRHRRPPGDEDRAVPVPGRQPARPPSRDPAGVGVADLRRGRAPGRPAQRLGPRRPAPRRPGRPERRAPVTGYLIVLAAVITADTAGRWAFLPAKHLPRNRARALRVRLHLRLHPGKGFATIVALHLRWGRLAALRRSRRICPSLPWLVRAVAPAEHSVFLGRAHWRHHLRVPLEEHVLVMAPPRTYKTAFLADVILRHPGAVLATTTKADVYRLTAAVRSWRGPVHVFNPQSIGGVPSTFAWSPVDGCEDPATAIRRADAFAFAVSREGVEGGTFWSAKASDYLRGYFCAAALGGYDMAAVATWVSGADPQVPERILNRARARQWALTLAELRSPAQKTTAISARERHQRRGPSADHHALPGTDRRSAVHGGGASLERPTGGFLASGPRRPLVRSRTAATV